jgi:hypothetical protein
LRRCLRRSRHGGLAAVIARAPVAIGCVALAVASVATTGERGARPGAGRIAVAGVVREATVVTTIAAAAAIVRGRGAATTAKLRT